MHRTALAMPSYDLVPRCVPAVHTRFRRIATPIPVPESVPILQELQRHEPRSMSGQPLVLWDRAEGVQVFDRWGNCWLDWSSGVLVTNAGHAHPRVCQAIRDQVDHGLLHNYCFPSEVRARLVARLARVAPAGLGKVFLLTTGAETVECAIKLSRTWGQTLRPEKTVIVTFDNAFHGRTLGAQMAGGSPALKKWIVNLDPHMVQVPFPDGFRGGPDTGFGVFLRSLEAKGIGPERVAGVITETYQGGNSSFAPPEYIRELRAWCDRCGALLTFDEVQAGFGRTGRYWGFEHYGVVPDLICCGKGISSGLPLSCVIGRPDVMDIYPPNAMTSTHTGNPVCAASALANLDVIDEERLVENAERMGAILQPEARRIGARFPQHVGAVHGKGLVASLHMVRPGGIEPNAELAWDVIRRAIEKGLMLFSPVGYGGASVKLAPPLVIGEEALREGLAVIEEAVTEAVG